MEGILLCSMPATRLSLLNIHRLAVYGSASFTSFFQVFCNANGESLGKYGDLTLDDFEAVYPRIPSIKVSGLYAASGSQSVMQFV